MKKTLLAFGFLGFGVITSLTTYILAQTRAPEIPPIATDVTAEDNDKRALNFSYSSNVNMGVAGSYLYR